MSGGGGKGGSAGGDISGAITEAAQQAAAYAEKYGQMGIDELRKQYDLARKDYDQYYKIARADTAPYRQVGLNALDQYSDTFGVARPENSFRLSQLLSKQAEVEAAKKAATTNSDWDSRINQYMSGAQHMAGVLGGGPNGGSGNAARDILTPSQYGTRLNDDTGGKIQFLRDVAGRVSGYGNLSEHAAYTSANKAGIDQLYSDYQKFKNTPQTPETPAFTPEEQAILDGYKNGTNPGVTANSATTLSKYFSTPEYNLLFGNSGKAVDPNASPLERFQADPGYQFMMDEGVKARNAAASAGGYLNSPRLLQELQTYGQGVGNQEFGNYRNRLTDSFRSYQNRLGQLAGLGATMGQNASNQAVNQGYQLGGLNTQLGNSVAGIYQGIGDAYSNSALASGQARASSYAMDQNAANQRSQGFAQLGGALGSYFGGPLGGVAGGALGSFF
jgi:hypothetical protein